MAPHKNQSETKATFRAILIDELTAWKEGISRSSCDAVSDNNPFAMINGIFNTSLDYVDFPCQLSNWQRKVVHTVAVELDLWHGSFGQKSARYVRVSKVPLAADVNTPSHVENKVTLDYQYYHLSEDDILRTKLDLEGMGRSYSSDVGSWLARLEQDLAKAHTDAYSGDLSTHVGITTANSVGDGASVSCFYVDNEVTLVAMSTALRHCRVVAFDMEMHSYRCYLGMTCLLQIACHAVPCADLPSPFSAACSMRGTAKGGGEGGHTVDLDFLVDTLAIPWATIRKELSPVFADPSIVKVCHGAQGGDIPALYRDFGVVVVNGFDTMEACRLLGFKRPGLAHMLVHLRAPGCGEGSAEVGQSEQGTGGHGGGGYDLVTLKEALGTADWRQRPLPEQMLWYAQMDVRFLVPLYFICLRLLHDKARIDYENSLLSIDPPPSPPEDPPSGTVASSLECVGGEGGRRSSIGSVGDLEEQLQYQAMWDQWGVEVNASTDAGENDDPDYTLSSMMAPPPPDVTDTPVHHLKYIIEIFALTHSAASSSLWSPPVDPRSSTSRGSQSTGVLHPYATAGASSSLLRKKLTGFKARRKSKKWSERATFVTKRLLLWRECIAISLDESPAFVCPSSFLLDVAEAATNSPRPLTISDLRKLQNPLPALVLRDVPARVPPLSVDHGASPVDDSTHEWTQPPHDDCNAFLRAVSAALEEYGEHQERIAAEKEQTLTAARDSCVTDTENVTDEKGHAVSTMTSQGRHWLWSFFVSGWFPPSGGPSTSLQSLGGLGVPAIALCATGSVFVIRKLIANWNRK